MEMYEYEYCVRGYHVYRAIWAAAVGEVLECKRELRNTTDRYAVAVEKDGTVIGQLPRKISKVCSLFLRRGGIIQCTVSGTRRFSADLLQGGVKIPCVVKCTANAKEIRKPRLLMKRR